MNVLNHYNVNALVNHDISVVGVCPNDAIALKLYENAYKIWHVPGKTKAMKMNLEIFIRGASMQFMPIKWMYNRNLDRLHGMYLFHPDLNDGNNKTDYNLIENMKEHNIRWRISNDPSFV